MESSGEQGGNVIRDASASPAAFTLSRGPVGAVPVVIAVPHAGRVYPDALLARMRHPAETAMRLEDRYVDLVARDVVQRTGATMLLAHAPRALIDLNRSPDDMDWEMVAGGAPRGTSRLAAGRRARSGLGLVPRRLAGLGELWTGKLPGNELADRIEHVHRPYHAALSRALESVRDLHGAVLLVDLHSMPPLGSKTGPDAAADFVIGDRYGVSCASHLSLAAAHILERAGWRVANNRPYAGGYVLDRHANPARGIHALQLEVCRTTYLDARLREPGDGLPRVVAAVEQLVRQLAARLDDGWSAQPQAAE